jgi:NMD protein affecting ribosome stability and mRNA decay
METITIDEFSGKKNYATLASRRYPNCHLDLIDGIYYDEQMNPVHETVLQIAENGKGLRFVNFNSLAEGIEYTNKIIEKLNTPNHETD